ncbi:MAG TPA: NUDIX hydrolase [Trebonia sp.]|nr:NUDIX hydrolase [Trebonia sp.]
MYGWLLCPATGRVLIQEQDDGIFSLPGGTPEPFDADLDATLAREAFEENQVRISVTTAYLGYQEVRQPGRPVFAQLRMAGIITEFAARAPDPDNGRLNRRYMTSLAAAPACWAGGSPPRRRPAPPPRRDAGGDCPSTARPPLATRTEPMPSLRGPRNPA